MLQPIQTSKTTRQARLFHCHATFSLSLPFRKEKARSPTLLHFFPSNPPLSWGQTFGAWRAPGRLSFVFHPSVCQFFLSPFSLLFCLFVCFAAQKGGRGEEDQSSARSAFTSGGRSDGCGWFCFRMGQFTCGNARGAAQPDVLCPGMVPIHLFWKHNSHSGRGF